MKTNKTIEERIEAAVVDALQRYPDMHPLAREHFVNYLLTGESDGTEYAHVRAGPTSSGTYTWLVSVDSVRQMPDYLERYVRDSGYKETLTNVTDD